MVQFSKLRLNGFKSFADNTELDILPGLTGIIGPNGCGKSNLTEALRWLMGETSPKSLRGSEMDDVIFAGTGKRSSRNFAEVVLSLGNSDGLAPEPYSKLASLDVSRRIDRGMGSDYRINGKIVRAGDVQLLFADSATGANSPSIVSQGRVTHLIQAKPVDRRRVLEDAAAISGLHNRRKEAETRLRAAEKNLTRVDDLLVQKSVLHEQLLKQAKQAERYRSLSDMLRRLEALTMAMEWVRVAADTEAAQSSMVIANEAQNQARQSLYELGKERETLQAGWEALETRLHALQQATQDFQRQKDRAEEELRRFERTRADMAQQDAALTQDKRHEEQVLAQTVEKLDALDAEKTDLERQSGNFAEDLATSASARDKARSVYDLAQQALSAARAEHAALNAQRHMLHQQNQRLQSEKSNLAHEDARVAQSLAQLAADLGADDISVLAAELQSFEQDLQAALEDVTQLEKHAESAAVAVKTSYETLQAAQSVLARIDTETKALSSLAEGANKTGSFATILDKIQVDAGYEQALSVALGRELRAGLDDHAPTYWRQDALAPETALPAGSVALFSVARAPLALSAALQAVGVVEDRAAGVALLGALKPGQMLVSKDGHGWRWDGYTVTPQAQASAQERETRQLLEQRNRLIVLRDERNSAAVNADAVQEAYQACLTEQQDLRQQTIDARNRMTQLQRDIGQARASLGRAQQKQAETQARRNAMQEKQQDLAARLTQADENLAQLNAQMQDLPPEAATHDRLETLQHEAREAEAAYRLADQGFTGLHARHAQIQNRLQAIARDSAEWQERKTHAGQRLVSFAERLDRLHEALAQLQSPDHVQEQIDAAETGLRRTEAQQFELQTRRGELAKERLALDGRNQEKQEALMTAREALVRAETQFHNGNAMREQLVERCRQILETEPQDIAVEYGFDDDELGQNLQAIRGKQDRARSERDRIGAVNLRAAEEAATLGAEIDTLTGEKDDIAAAIEKLRHGISTLNRDARRKMLAAFDEVNTRFKEVFTRLFHGGEAYLQLIDAEDPLEAGLEIFASPPGKRLQSLTLLSGGEQSLTAIALVFAMFLTHPSPICILDEIDAALDDANVERICSLLGDFAKTHPTRFLVITHNPITMTYMDRLYGVTMVEKGVSKLVSVDLNHYAPQLAMAAE